MNQRQETVSDALCAYALNLRYEDIPPPVIERTKDLFIDFLACTLGGHAVADSTGPITAGVKALAGGSGGSCTVIGEVDNYPPQYAALLNGAYAHSMDFDDIHRDAVMHPAVTIFPTVLAAGEMAGTTGRDLLAAAVVGYDLANKIGKVHGTFVHARGFHPTATTGTFACTGAGARLLGLTLEQTRNAFGMNISQTAGALQYEFNGAWDKRIHAGLAAHNALLSLVLARHGYRGSTEPLEGKYGYFALYASKPLEPARALDGLGTEFEVMNTAVKPYPCCRCSQSIIDAVIGFVTEHGLAPSDIAAITAEIGHYSHGLVADNAAAKKRPRNIVEAQFSAYFAAAAAARGAYTWASYDLIGDAEMEDLMQRVTVNAVDDVSQYGTRVVLATVDGRRLEADVPLPKGEPEVPLGGDEFDRKFLEWGEPALGASIAAEVTGMIRRLEDVPDVRALTERLRAPARQEVAAQ